MQMYFDKDGSPLGLWEWARKFEDVEYRRVGLDEREGIEVSTVWLGLNHSFLDGPLLIFETMVFDNQDLHGYSLGEELPYRDYPQDLT